MKSIAVSSKDATPRRYLKRRVRLVWIHVALRCSALSDAAAWISHEIQGMTDLRWLREGASDGAGNEVYDLSWPSGQGPVVQVYCIEAFSTAIPAAEASVEVYYEEV